MSEGLIPYEDAVVLAWDFNQYLDSYKEATIALDDTQEAVVKGGKNLSLVSLSGCFRVALESRNRAEENVPNFYTEVSVKQ